MEVTFLGTSSMVPTKDRNQIAVFLSYDTEGILFDCGEGTQRQFKIAGISLQKITRILISHWHGDHVLGLPGIIQTLSSLGYSSTLHIYGPKGKKVNPDEVSHVEPGKKIGYVTDTTVCNNCYKIAQDADLLICEATYSSKLADKSEEYNHMTAKQAAHIANNSNVKKLALIHFSARYKDTSELEEDAKDLFDNVVCTNDFMKIKL